MENPNDVRRRVVLLDAHPLRLEATGAVAERAGLQVAAKATSEASAFAALAEHDPELLIATADGGWTDESAQLVGRVRDRYPGVRVIVSAESNDPSAVASALDAGAAAYVVSSAKVEDLALAIRQVFKQSVFTFGAKVGTVRDDDAVALVGLTTRELDVLRLVATGCSNADVAVRLGMAPPTVKFHLAGIFRKLGVANRTAATDWALRNGLVELPGRRA